MAPGRTTEMDTGMDGAGDTFGEAVKQQSVALRTGLLGTPFWVEQQQCSPLGLQLARATPLVQTAKHKTRNPASTLFMDIVSIAPTRTRINGCSGTCWDGLLGGPSSCFPAANSPRLESLSVSSWARPL